ncbi:MAG: hypothetical protein AAGL66_15250, partial [Pseudomonadota bacterium]
MNRTREQNERRPGILGPCLLGLSLGLTATLATAAGGGHTALAALEYREGHREAAEARREAFMAGMGGGLAVITSADRSQPNLYEFYTPDTEHKDFVFLTGIYDSHPPGHVLVMNPVGAGNHRKTAAHAGHERL